MKTTILFVSLILAFQLSFSQSGMPLKESNKIYLHGSSILIGNNILGHHSNKPLMDGDIANDMVKMKYIDVDDDKNTFSSSEASVRNAPQNPNVAYAALYWSALYPFNKGVAKKSGSKMIYKGRGERDSIVNTILFKRPNDAEYKAITGDVVFDSYKEKAFENNMPYVSYADVTAELQELSDINGAYTVANVLATEGQILGGGSAGWLLYIVYEDETESLKYFSTYDGLVEVNRNAVEISFKDFKNKEDGDIRTTIALGAMEGDRRIKTDELSIFSAKSDEYTVLSTPHREENNFFNSSITIGEKLFSDRNPNSINTLGFDLLKMEIPNDGNKFFDNSTTQARLKFQTRADRFYLHFVAFETEISQDYFARYVNLESDSWHGQNEEIIEVAAASIASDLGSEEENIGKTANEDSLKSTSTSVKEYQTALVIHEKMSQYEEKIKPKQVSTLSEGEKEALRRGMEAQVSWDIPDLEKGYYIVVNVFADPENAKRWSEFIKKKDYQPRSIINPKNNWDYIFISHGEDFEVIFKERLEYRKRDYFKDVWVMKVNFT